MYDVNDDDIVAQLRGLPLDALILESQNRVDLLELIWIG